MKLHHSKVREISIIRPYGFGWIRMNLENSPSLYFSDTSACRKESFFIKVDLGQRDITIVESNALFPPRENFGELGIMLRISYLNLHHFHFVTAPELSLTRPLVPCGPSLFLKKVEESEKIFFLSLCVESRPEGIFQSAKPSILFLDP
jgi:hypothetical protein